MKTAIKVNKENLHLLGPRISVPQYDRSKVRASIVHMGVGGFHRSHQAFYTDALMNKTNVLDWGICGVGLREGDRRIHDILKDQDYLYTLLSRFPDGKIETRVIGSIVDFMLGVDDPMAVIEKMACEETKIISLTITEGGYNFHPVTGEFLFENEDVQYDLANPDSPRLVFGYLSAALKKRRAAGLKPFTILSCDNIQHNGDVAKKMLLAFVEKQDPELASWIESEVNFPNTMVDRITPVTTPADIEALADEFGVKDKWPVTCEPFCQWVIEDKFSDGRPSWESVGAQFVPDVSPYETMKLRLLNAGHSVLGLLGSIHGHETIDTCMADPLFAAYLRQFMDTEVTPVLAPVDGIDLSEYKDSLIERFGNRNIKDNLARICLESSSKLPKFLIPTIVENLQRKGSIKYSALVIAAWCYYSDKGINKNGEKLQIVDEMKAELHKAAAATSSDKLSFLRLDSIFGDLANCEAFTTEYIAMVDALYQGPNVAELMSALLPESLAKQAST